MMVYFRLTSLLLFLGAQDAFADDLTCSGRRTSFGSPGQSKCMTTWGVKNVTKIYPDDFDNITNVVNIYMCPALNKKIMISNGIPDHTVRTNGAIQPCEVNWVIETPLHPKVAHNRTEVPMRGMIAMATNGVPAFGPQETDFNNAVEPGDGKIQGAQFWYGHSSGQSVWHVHNPHMGEEHITKDTLLGYAMDGFPIYGALDDDDLDELDPCNGKLDDQGDYQYHVRKLSQVDENKTYCNEDDSPETNWNYILGCYSGTVANSRVFDSQEYYLDTNFCFDEASPTPAPTTKSPSHVDTRPNIIIIQPDDLPFFDEWGAPPNIPNRGSTSNNLPKAGMPHIEKLRNEGLQMMQAYTSSPMCGTSRYSTISGKYPSRSSFNRETAGEDENVAFVTIPTTKLADMNGYHDCSGYNMASTFRNSGYHTSMIGKWHLSNIKDETYTYDTSVDIVSGCGFDTVAGLYIENLKDGTPGNEFGNFADGTFSHNMEWITYEAIKIINEQADKPTREPFFMYFNPTVPHGANDVADALKNFTCRDTANGTLDFDPLIPGMTGAYDGSCEEYRESIYKRTEYNENDYGAVWLDDGVGAILKTLEEKSILSNTIIIFQEDHGMDLKGSLYEQGVRIPQFIHYPDQYSPHSTFDAPVSVVDIAATMFDFAGITPNYELDGESWKEAVGDEEQKSYWKNERCLFFEASEDRGVRCGCDKYLTLLQDETLSDTYKKGLAKNYSVDKINLFDLCGGTNDYITDKSTNMEEFGKNLAPNDEEKALSFISTLQCHLNNTDLQEEMEYAQCTLDYVAPPSLSPAPSLPLCRDTPSDTFFWKYRRNDINKPLFRDCEWLENEADPSQICENNVDEYVDENGVITLPAREVCKAICLTCFLLHPSQTPSLTPPSSSMNPSLIPTQNPTDVTSEPSASPSGIPSLSPTIIPSIFPTDLSPCGDGDGKFYWKTNAKKEKDIKKTCAWLAKLKNEKKKTNICKKKDGKDGFPPAKELCLQTCDKCPKECADGEDRFYWYTNDKTGKDIKKTCEWLANEDEKRISNICKKEDGKDGFLPAREVCLKTCNTCQ